MSNETSSINRPPYVNRSGRSRKFSCITYLDQLRLDLCLMHHSNQIRAYAYAYHDNDVKEDGTLKEPHYHLVIVTYCTCTCSSIRRWFSGFQDDKGLDLTTTSQICSDVFQMYDYLTHNTLECKQLGKYQYSKDIVKSNDFGYFKADERSSYDNITLACEMLLHGDSVHDVAKIFGRDFILHYNAIKNYVNDVMKHRKYHTNLELELEREYQTEISILNGDYKANIEKEEVF